MASRQQTHIEDRGRERGQTTVALAGVLVVAGLLIIALAWIGEAIVHRASARTAADAVALAGAIDDGAADQLADWYRAEGAIVERRGAQTHAASGPSQAAAWAGFTVGTPDKSPVLVAIVARAEQLLGHALVVVEWRTRSVVLAPAAAAAFNPIAAEFSLCSLAPEDPNLAVTSFTWC